MTSRVAVGLGLLLSLTACGGGMYDSDYEHSSPEDPIACAGVEFPADRWTEATRERVRSGILASVGAADLAEQARLADRMIASLDESAKRWSQLRRQACVSTRVEGRLSEDALAKIDACLFTTLATRQIIVAIASSPPPGLTIGRLEPNVLAMDTDADLCLYEAYFSAHEPRTAETAKARDAIGEIRAYRWFDLYDRAQAAGERAVEAAAKGPPGLRAEALIELAWTLIEAGDHDAAEPLAKKAVREAKRADYELGVALARQALARVAQARGDYADAIAIYRELEAEYERLLGLDRYELGHCLYDLAMAHAEAGDFNRARTAMHRSTRHTEAVYGQDSPITASAYASLAWIVIEQGELELGLTYYQQALAARQRVLGSDHPDTMTTLHDIGTTLTLLGRCAEATPILEQALADRRRVLGDDHYETGVTHYELGAAQLECKQHDSSLRSFEQAKAIFSKVGDPIDVANAEEYLGTVHYEQGRHDQALAAFEQTLRIRTRELGDNHPDTAAVHLTLAEVARAKGDRKQVLVHLRNALKAHERAEVRDEPMIRSLRSAIVGACEQEPSCR